MFHRLILLKYVSKCFLAFATSDGVTSTNSLIFKYDFECFSKSGCQLGLVFILAFFTQSLNYVIHGEESNVRKGREGKKVSKPS